MLFRSEKRDPANTTWQRDLSISHERIGNALRSQGYGRDALKAYQKSLEIKETLTKLDPANTQWQVDLTIVCLNLGTLENVLAPSTRRAHLQRGLAILLRLKDSGKLHPSQDNTALFVKQIQKLDAVVVPFPWTGAKPS